MPNRDLSDFRENYQFGQLLEEQCSLNPFVQFKEWLDYAINNNIFEPNGMQLATVGKNNQPSLRTLLLKEVTEKGFVFYTNFESKKGIQLAENNKAAILFWWREQERQIRIEGVVEKYSIEKSKKYFYSRPKGSQIAATVSPQSKVIPNRAFIDKLYFNHYEKYGDLKFPFPDNWGGYILVPTLFEFWQGRENRLHDRIQYLYEEGNWRIERLAP